MTDGGECFHIWRVIMNILSNLSHIVSRLSNWVGIGIQTIILKKHVMKCYAGPQTVTESFKWHEQRKIGMIFGTFNDSNLCRWCSLESVAKELAKYEGESVNRSQTDTERKTCDIRTWEKHLFLNISSTRIDTLVPLLYQCAETCSIEVIWLLSQAHHQRNFCHHGGFLADQTDGHH
jgi:hypothetical protein